MTGDRKLPRDFAPVGTAHDPAFLRGRQGHRLVRWRRSSLRRLVVVALVLVAAGALTLRMVRASGPGRSDGRFVLKTVRLEGIASPRRPALEQAVAPLVGRDLVALDLDEARRDLEALPWIEGASLAKQLPSTLVIRVRERVAVAFVSRHGHLEYLAGDGRLMGPFERGHGEIDLPVLVGEPGEEDLRRVGRFLGELARNHPEHFRRIPEIRAGEDGSLVVWDPVAGCDLVVDPDGFPEAFARWLSLEPEVSKRFGDLESVDLRFRDRIVLRPAVSASA